MEQIENILKTLQDQKPYLSQRYGITILGVFGSYVRGEQSDESDIDILVELEETRHVDLFDLANIERYLCDLLGLKVDLAIKSGLQKRIGKRILEEVVPV